MLTWSLFQVTLPSPADETAITKKVEVEIDDLKVENEKEEDIRTGECVQNNGKNGNVYDGSHDNITLPSQVLSVKYSGNQGSKHSVICYFFDKFYSNPIELR